MTTIFETTRDLDVSRLVAAAREGDSEAMSELFLRFQGMVMSIAHTRIRDRDDAEDLCQETFFRAFRKLRQLKVDAAFAGWLRQIAVNMANNFACRRRLLACVDHEILDRTIADEADGMGEAVGAVIRREKAEKLREGLTRLAKMDRETLVAFYLEGQSLRDMSIRFGSPLGTIKRRLHDARQRLARECATLI